ncbi:MAG: hypothetical protein HRU19_13520 [Pseudobacteriovorax sp.]|nr:hypothetical protein [Pseudobacteriovorax sp.]
MTLAEATTLFATAGSAPNSTINVGDASFPNGGFESIDLTGPDQMHLNPNMILVVEADGKSYQYFNLDVSTLSYTP